MDGSSAYAQVAMAQFVAELEQPGTWTRGYDVLTWMRESSNSSQFNGKLVASV